MTTEEQVKTVAAALSDKKAADLRVYDVRGISGLCDYYVVVTGTAAPHLKALIAESQRVMKEHGVRSFRTSGDPESGWIVIDYVDFVVHAFSPEARAYYAVEKLWEKAKTVEV